MASANDIFQFKVAQTYGGQEILNVFHYRLIPVTGLTFPAGLNAALGDFKTTVWDVCRSIQSARVTTTSIELLNLSNPVETVSAPFSLPGLINDPASADLPSFIAYSFRLLRETRATRFGYKRIAGVVEGAVQLNETTGIQAQITAVQDALGATLFLGGALEALSPIILRRQPSLPLVAPVFSEVSAGEYRGIGSQNTRKRGRGN